MKDALDGEETPCSAQSSTDDQLFTIHVRQAISGAPLAQVQAGAVDSIASLRRAVMLQVVEMQCSFELVFDGQVLRDNCLVGEAGLADGTCVDLVRLPLTCLTASYDGAVRLWDENGECRRVFAQNGPVRMALLASHALFTLSLDGIGRLWDVETGELRCVLNGESVRLLSATLSPDGSLLLGGLDDGIVAIWSTHGELQQLLMGHEDEVRCVAFAGDRLASASCDGFARLWDGFTGQCLHILGGHSDLIRSIDLSNDGSLLVTASADGTAVVWDSTSGKRLQILHGHTKGVLHAEFDPAGRGRVLTAAQDGTARVWLAASGECMRVFEAQSAVINFAKWSPDGGFVLVASGSEIVDLFSVEARQNSLTLVGHADWVRHASFSRCGLFVITASIDSTAKLWSVVTGESLQTFVSHTQPVAWSEVIAGRRCT